MILMIFFLCAIQYNERIQFVIILLYRFLLCNCFDNNLIKKKKNLLTYFGKEPTICPSQLYVGVRSEKALGLSEIRISHTESTLALLQLYFINGIVEGRSVSTYSRMSLVDKLFRNPGMVPFPSLSFSFSLPLSLQRPISPQTVEFSSTRRLPGRFRFGFRCRFDVSWILLVLSVSVKSYLQWLRD